MNRSIADLFQRETQGVCVVGAYRKASIRTPPECTLMAHSGRPITFANVCFWFESEHDANESMPAKDKADIEAAIGWAAKPCLGCSTLRDRALPTPAHRVGRGKVSAGTLRRVLTSPRNKEARPHVSHDCQASPAFGLIASVLVAPTVMASVADRRRGCSH